MLNYLHKESIIVKKYILDQFVEKGKEEDIIVFHDSRGDISVIKTTSNSINTYITLGAGAREMNIKRKDLRYTELVACSTDQITKEQEEFLVKKLCEFIPSAVDRNEYVGEYHTMDWPQKEKQHLFNYDFFMLLRAAEPLELKNKSIQFLILLPLYAQERNWIVTPGWWDKFSGKNELDMAIAYGTYFLEYCVETYPSNEFFCVDYFRDCADKNSPSSFDFSSAENKDLSKTTPHPIPLYLQKGRRIGSSLWKEVRTSLPRSPKAPNVKKQWKYEKTETEVTILEYIGQELNVVVPKMIDGLPVTRIHWNAFSPEKCLSQRVRETRGLLTEVVLPNTIDTMESLFQGCSCLERVIFSDNIKKIESSCFLNCPSLRTNKYRNGMYIGTADNPYYALVRVEENTKHVVLHEKTVIIADGIFDSWHKAQVEILEAPANMKSFDYSSFPTKSSYGINLKIRAPENSEAILFAKKNNLDYE